MKKVSREIGWSPNSNLLFQITKALNGENSMISNEIGWGTETKLLAGMVDSLNCQEVCVTTTTTTEIPL